MSKYLLIYKGGSEPSNDKESLLLMKQWQEWFNTISSSVVDLGFPVMSKITINKDSSSLNTGSNLTGGYSIIKANSIEDISLKVKNCPILEVGGNIEISEIIEI